MSSRDFEKDFKTLTGHGPFPWQKTLFKRFTAEEPPGHIPDAASLPTGLGKTSVIAVWLLAWLKRPEAMPRRLVYVVNRRTVVDQTTAEVERLRERLPVLNHPALDTLAVSTLRGQFADNQAWSADPSRPAVICGTVDMIGSRLLFSGYRIGFKSRPLHAGFLGQDSLLIHDEAHLEPAFQELVEGIASEQAEEHRRTGFGRPMRVMKLSATVRGTNGRKPLTLEEEDRNHPVVRRRIRAGKHLRLHPQADAKLAKQIEALALSHHDSGQAVLIFVRAVDDAIAIADALNKAMKQQGAADRVQRLTGTMRGQERDGLFDDPVFRRFLPDQDSDGQTVYLVCTAAGEVGVNLSADHLVCDLTCFDSMAQRLGRVNRFGEPSDHIAQVDVVYPETFDDNAYGIRLSRTLDLLRELPQPSPDTFDASPDALESLPAEDRGAAFTPKPEILPVSSILFDAWAMTSLARPLAKTLLPGCPPVALYLHGKAEWEPPQTQVAWRDEVRLITGEAMAERYPPEDLLAAYPLKPHELIRDNTARVYIALSAISKRLTDGDVPFWIIDDRGRVDRTTFGGFPTRDKKQATDRLADTTVLLPPDAGGLSSGGVLDGKQPFDPQLEPGYDIADLWLDDVKRPRRWRGWDNEPCPEPSMRRVLRIEVFDPRQEDSGDPDDDALLRYWDWYAAPRSADDDGSQTTRFDQPLDEHQQLAYGLAQAMVGRLELGADEAKAVALAAAWHDKGKHRETWQASIGNMNYPGRVLAKSAGRMLPFQLSHYRHEFGSVLDVLDDSQTPEFKGLPEATGDLLLHLIAAHHGRARPHFPAEETDDPAPADQTDAPAPGRAAAARALALETPRRYARLQNRYGRWGLAYLESLVRAADYAASSAQPSQAQETARS